MGKIFTKKISSSILGRELIFNSFWSIFGALVSKGLFFLAWIIVARILGTNSYGEFGIIRNTILMFSTFAGFGIGLTATKFVSEYINKDKAKAERIISLTMLSGYLMGIIVSLFLFIFSDYLSSTTLNAPHLSIDLKIASLSLFFSSVNGAQIGVLQGLQSFKGIAIINTLQAIISFPIFIIGALYGGVFGSIIAFLFSIVIICILSSYKIHKEMFQRSLKFDYKNAWLEKDVLIHFSLPAFFSGISVVAIKWIADVMLVNQEEGYHSMGVFTAAFTFNTILMMFAVMLDAPFLTLMSKYKENNNVNIQKVNVIAPWLIGVFLILPFLVYPELGALFFGKEFYSEDFKWAFIWILSFTMVLMFKQGLSRILAVYNLQWWGMFSNFIWGIVLLLMLFFEKNKGATGLAFSYCVAYIVNTVITLPLYFYKKIIPKSTIISKESFGIWMVFIILIILNLYEISYFLRFIVLLLSYISIFYMFYHIYKSK